MKIIKKTIMLLCLLAAFSILPALTPISLPGVAPATAYAGYDFCEDLPVGTCEEENITFTKYQGELVSINPEGYDPGLVKTKSVREFVQKVVNYALSFLGLVAIILIIYAGVMYLTAGGQTEKTDKAKKTIGYTTIGLLLILGSYAIVNTILTGPFEGEGAVEGEVQGWAATGFNASTEAISTSTKEIVQGYIFVYESYETFKTLKSDLIKDSLIHPPKSLMLQYLNNARSKLQDLKFKTTAFSQVSNKINDTIRWLNQKMDKIQTLADIANSGEEENATSLQTEWTSIKTDLFTLETATSIPALFGVIVEDFAGPNGLLIKQLPKMDEAAKSIEGIAVENQVTSIADAFADLKTKITTLNNSIYAGTTGDSGTGTLIDELSGAEKSDVIGVTNQNLRDLVFAADKLTNLIKDVKFVQVKLVATAAEGSAPLIVRFDVLNSADPSGETIKPENIEWDLMGDGYGKSGDKDQNCYKAGYNPWKSGNGNNFVGFTTYCIYENPGTYRASVKIKSDKPEKYGAGESKLDIKVKEPELKIGLTVQDEVLEAYENDLLTVSKNYISVIKDTAANEGIKFDASQTSNISGQSAMDLQFKWDFGNGKTGEEAAATGIKYEYDGVYTVVLEVKSPDGREATKIFNVLVGSPSARMDILPKGPKYLGYDLTFDASRSTSDVGEIKGYKWEIGTGMVGETECTDIIETVEEKMFTYAFEKSGNYYICLKVTDASGKNSQIREEIKIESKPPIAIFEYKIPEPTQPSTVIFDATKSYDPDGKFEDLTIEWTVGETEQGTYIVPEEDQPAVFPAKEKIVFNKEGEYDVTLTVKETNDTENVSTVTKTIKIDNTLDIKWDDSQDSTTSLNEEGVAEMPFKFKSSNAVAYEIDFGDGETENGAFEKGASVAETTHTFKESGKFEVRVRVYDEEDNSNEIKRKIFVGGGDKPVAKIAFYINGEEYIDYEEPVEASRADLITFDASESKNTDGTGKDLKYQWSFGDTKKSSQKTVIHKFSELSPPDKGFYTVTLKVYDQDDQDLTDEIALKLNIIPIAPKFSSLQALPQAGEDLTTPIKVNLELFGAIDLDGQITQYKWWYYDTQNPDDILGIQITDMPYSIITIGTMGKEGDKKTYGFGVEVTDNDNKTVSSKDELEEGQISTLAVTNGANAAPTAKFSVDRTNTMVGETINFSSASTDPDGKILEYVWDFEGDGFFNNEPTSLSTVAHSYAKKSLTGYKAKLKVVDDKYGEAVSQAITIYVDSLAEDPIAAFKTESVGGKLIEFTNNSTADAKAGVEIESYKWDFDIASQFSTVDSNGDGIEDNDVDSEQKDTIFEYKEFGTYQVKLTVMDTQGNEKSVINTVTVSAVATPTAPVTGTGTGTGGTGGTGTGTGTGTGDDYVPGSFGMDPGTGGTGSGGSLDKEPGAQGGTQPTTLQAIIITSPLPDADGVIRLSGTSGTVAFDFSKSTGSIQDYIFDKNIYFDTNKNGVQNDEEDFKTSLPGIWTTNFDKSWGKIVVKMTVVDIYGNKNSIVQEIAFK